MVRDINIIPHTVWEHTSGKNASIYGAAPWTSEADRANWKQVTRGYTWECLHHDGSVTVGLCRPPAKTYAEAERIRDKILAM